MVNNKASLAKKSNRSGEAASSRNSEYYVHYHPIHPGPPLNRFVEVIFHLKGYQPEHSIERIVPDTRSSLVMELDGQDRCVVDNESLKPLVHCRHSWLSGPHRNYFSISAKPDTELIAVQFGIAGLFPLVRVPIDEFADQVQDATNIFGDSIVQLRAEVLKAKSSDEKAKTVESWLTGTMDTTLIPPDGIQQAIDSIQNDPTLETVTSCISNSGFSQKHAIHLFKKHTGYRPKELQRILRFSKAIDMIQNGESVAWATLSSDCGYSDQAHFIRDFSSFSGFTPTGFQKVNTDRVNFIPIDKPSQRKPS